MKEKQNSGSVIFVLSFILFIVIVALLSESSENKRLRSLELARYNFTVEECIGEWRMQEGTGLFRVRLKSGELMISIGTDGQNLVKPTSVQGLESMPQGAGVQCSLYCHTRQVSEMERQDIERGHMIDINDFVFTDVTSIDDTRFQRVLGDIRSVNPSRECKVLTDSKDSTRVLVACEGEEGFTAGNVFYYNETVCAPKQECRTEVNSTKDIWIDCDYWKNPPRECIGKSGLIQTTILTTCTPIVRNETYGCKSGESVRKAWEMFG